MDTNDHPISPAAVAVPILAFITIVLDTPPLAWHIRNRNLPASSLVCWVILANLMNFVNALIWPRDNTADWWPGFGLCDVEVKLMLAEYVGVVSSLLCIMGTLAGALDTERALLGLSKHQRRMQLMTESLLCFGFPAYIMAVHYIVQPSRYYVFAIAGCTSSLDNSWPKLILIFIWPPFLSLVTVYYSVLVLIRMHRYRRNFSEVLASSSSDLTTRRFLRLFFMAMTFIIILLPVQAFVLYKNSATQLIPYSWQKVHSQTAWDDIAFVPTQGIVAFDRWIQLVIGFAVFFFFGLGVDAIEMYRQCFSKISLCNVFWGAVANPSNRDLSRSNGSRESSVSSNARLFVARVFKGTSTSSASNSNPPSSTAWSLPPSSPRSTEPRLTSLRPGPSPNEGRDVSSTMSQESGLHVSRLRPSEPSRLLSFLTMSHGSARNGEGVLGGLENSESQDVEKTAGQVASNRHGPFDFER